MLFTVVQQLQTALETKNATILALEERLARSEEEKAEVCFAGGLEPRTIKANYLLFCLLAI